MTSTINAAKRIFLSLPDHKRKAVVDIIVNVQGLKSPRTKAMKDYDKVRGTNDPRKGGNFMPMLFEQTVREFI